MQVNNCIWPGKQTPLWACNVTNYMHDVVNMKILLPSTDISVIEVTSFRHKCSGVLWCMLTNMTSYLCMSRPHMDLFLWKIALLRRHCRTEINSNILRNMKIRSPLIVIHFLNWKVNTELWESKSLYLRGSNLQKVQQPHTITVFLNTSALL